MNADATKAGAQNLAYLEAVYAAFRHAPRSVPAEWREFFADAGQSEPDGCFAFGPSFKPRSVFNPSGSSDIGRTGFELDSRSARLSDRLYRLVLNHRVRGHIIDQFISSAEDKWRFLSGLVLLLPHGFEGMGPEHSSARLERFLALAAEDNMQITQPTTPAQYFHLLRRQALSRWRKPLIVLTPKSLLRHPLVTSPLDDCARGHFQRVLPDGLASRGTQRVLLCGGKVYYDLATYRHAHDRHEVAIVRLEQLYPLRAEHLRQALEPYPDNSPVVWVQEEPANMGAWRYLHERFGKKLLGRFPFALVSRSESASPATGSAGAHRLEQAQLVARAFGDREPDVAAVQKP